jgi:hypothetical protein
MTSELETLRSVADRVQPPPFAALEDVARRRTRRTAVTAVAGCVLSVLVLVGGVVAVTARDDHSAPPVITPTPTPSPTPVLPTPTEPPKPIHRSDTSMTLAEVVSASDATLQLTGVSADDPDFRVAVWEATCHWCPKGAEARSKPSFRALAITSDGYATTILRRVPFDAGLEHVESVGPGLLLVVDDANGYEWLVRDDGTIAALERDFNQVPATDPRLWFVCLGSTGHTAAGGALPYDAQSTWCALDPRASRVHMWTGRWTRTIDDSESVVSPEGGVEPWGYRDPTNGPAPGPPDPGLVAWWDVDGARHYQDLSPAVRRGPVRNAPPGLISFWSSEPGSSSLTIHTSSDRGSSWQTAELREPARPPRTTSYYDVYWTPGGALLARLSESGGLWIWRAELTDDGAFEPVYELGKGHGISTYDLAFGFRGTQIWSSRIWSDDDGRTWQEVTTWRP